jgi:hypothetical protein
MVRLTERWGLVAFAAGFAWLLLAALIWLEAPPGAVTPQSIQSTPLTLVAVPVSSAHGRRHRTQLGGRPPLAAVRGNCGPRRLRDFGDDQALRGRRGPHLGEVRRQRSAAYVRSDRE